MVKLSELKQSKPQELHRDRISRVYLGEVSDAETQRRARERIDWIVESTDGERILDIGCSEGITAIKLAEQGKTVDALDIHPEVIAYAQALAANILPAGKRPNFWVQDIFDLDEIGQPYDTVIMGEVIEHVYEPAKMIMRATLALKPGGTMIITTPWGYFAAPDHHQTFFLSNFLDTIPGEMKIASISIKDGYIRFLATKCVTDRQKTKPSNLPQESVLLSLSETAALEGMRFLRDSFDQQSERLKAAWAAADAQKTNYTAAVEKQETRLQATMEKLAALRDSFDQQSERLKADWAAGKKWKDNHDQLAVRLKASWAATEALKSNHAKTVAALQDKLRAAEERLAQLASGRQK